MRLPIVPLVCLTLGLLPQALNAVEAGWSGALLREVLRGEAAAQAPRGTELGQGQEQKSPKQTAEKAGRVMEKEETRPVILKTYQLQHLRLGDNPRAQSTLQLLHRLLPKEATLRVDTTTNSLHLLASPAAHGAVWDFLSSLDVKDHPETASLKELSPQLQQVLREIEGAREGNAKLGNEIAELRRSVERHSQELSKPAPATPAMIRNPWLMGGGALFSLLIAGLVLHRRGKQKRLSLEANDSEADSRLVDTRPALHELLGSTKGISLQQRQLHQEMLEVINAAAIKMEAVYNERDTTNRQLAIAIANQEQALLAAQTAMSETKERLLAENAAMLRQANSRFELTADKLETGIDKLGRQNEKVEALVVELHSTVSELDQTKDEMLRLQTVLDRKSTELDSTRHSLAAREMELTKEQAKLAALTLILEEGYHFRTGDQVNAQATPAQNNTQADSTLADIISSAGTAGEQTPNDKPSSELEPSDPKDPCTATPPGQKYQFLPPDHPET